MDRTLLCMIAGGLAFGLGIGVGGIVLMEYIWGFSTWGKVEALLFGGVWGLSLTIFGEIIGVYCAHWFDK